MSYGTGEDALLTTVRLLSIWDTENTGASKWDLLNDGKARYLIVRPGEEFNVETISIDGTVTRTPYSSIVEIWRLHQDQTNVRELLDDVDTTMVQIEKFPYLGQGQTGDIMRAYVTSGGEVEARWATAGNGPNWLVQELVVIWTEERRTAHSE